MPQKPSWLTFSRWSWFAVVGGLLGARDMCAGGGHPPPDPPADAAPTGTGVGGGTGTGGTHSGLVPAATSKRKG
jgi:hypothetical protein